MTTGERSISARANTLLDKETFQQIAEIATMMASASLIPESLSHEGSGDKKKPLPPETVRANCFLVANQAIKWSMDPFSVAQCCSVVHGRLMFEGKLVAAVLEANLGIKLVHAYGKWDRVKEACIVGTDGAGDDLAIRIGEGRYDENGVAAFSGRFVDGHVGGWKTTGANSPWRPGRFRTMLIYRGAREFSRVYEPGIMLGVIADDEYDPAYNAKDITPPPSGCSGQSVIDRLKAQKSDAAAGFDHDRVKQDLKSAVPPRGEEEAVGDSAASSEAGDPRESAPASHVSNRGTGSASQADHAEEEGAGLASSLPSDPIDEQDWLLNVAGMLWAATNFNGDPDLLKAQRKAAAASYPTDGRSEKVLAKAKAVFDRCATVVSGECPPEDGIAIVAGIVGVEEKVLAERAGKAGA